jgi:hypothetical protein
LWKWIAAGVAGLVTVSGLLAYYPWLSLEIDKSVNPVNPYEDYMHVENGGYLPISEPSVTCIPTIRGAITIRNNFMVYDRIVKRLPYRGKLSIPCDRDIKIAEGAGVATMDLDIVVEYGVWLLPFRQRQQFHLSSETDLGGRWHWVFR